jgi:hypothetical protein
MSEAVQTIKCNDPQCGQEFQVIIPQAGSVNNATLSMIYWPHPEPQLCPHCGRAYQMQVTKVDAVKIAWAPVRTQNEASIVVPPAGFKLPKIGGR